MNVWGDLRELHPPPLSDSLLHELCAVSEGRVAGTAAAHGRRAELARRELLRAATQARWDGLEILAGWVLTPAGCIELSAWEARVRDARGPPPGEVIRRGATDAACGSGHDTQGDSP